MGCLVVSRWCHHHESPLRPNWFTQLFTTHCCAEEGSAARPKLSSWAAKRKTLFSYLFDFYFFFACFFKVGLSSTGASLGWESETELCADDGLRWAGRAQQGEISWEGHRMPSLCSHLVDQRSALPTLPAGRLPGVTAIHTSLGLQHPLLALAFPRASSTDPSFLQEPQDVT